MHNFYVQSKQFVTYLLLLIDNFLKVAFICNTLSLTDSQNCQKIRAIALDLWSQFHTEQRASAPVLCVGDSCVCILLSIPIGRNPGP
jgi:hypothetical protein